MLFCYYCLKKAGGGSAKLCTSVYIGKCAQMKPAFRLELIFLMGVIRTEININS